MEFKGAALYTGVEITSAVKHFKEQQMVCEQFWVEFVKGLEAAHKPNLVVKYLLGKTLHERWLRKKDYSEFGRYLSDRGYLVLIAPTTLDLIEITGVAIFTGFLYNESSCETVTELDELSQLGKDCYLNPTQASVVNKWVSHKLVSLEDL